MAEHACYIWCLVPSYSLAVWSTGYVGIDPEAEHCVTFESAVVEVSDFSSCLVDSVSLIGSTICDESSECHEVTCACRTVVVEVVNVCLKSILSVEATALSVFHMLDVASCEVM